MSHSVCPWWLGYALANPLRRLVQNPEKILYPFLQPGMTVLEPGSGMGFFTLEIARLVHLNGRVVAVDIQPKMLDVLANRARRSGLGDRVETRLSESGNLGVENLAGKVDFVLAFAMVHEFPDAGDFFMQIQKTLKRQAKVLMAEPEGHVSPSEFARSITAANQNGLVAIESPRIWRSRTVVLQKA